MLGLSVLAPERRPKDPKHKAGMPKSLDRPCFGNSQDKNHINYGKMIAIVKGIIGRTVSIVLTVIMLGSLLLIIVMAILVTITVTVQAIMMMTANTNKNNIIRMAMIVIEKDL